MTLAADLSKAVAAPVFLAEVTCGLYCPCWEVHSGSAYKLAVTDKVSAVAVNGVALTLGSSAANVVSNAGRWYWDGDYVYVRLADSSDPNVPATVVMATLTFYWADKTIELDGHYWEARLVDIPSLSFRIESDFKTTPQTSGGKLGLQNVDRFFDSRKDRDLYRWDFGTCVLRMGTEGLAWADYVKMATWDNRNITADDLRVVLDLVEPKSRLKREFPLEVYGYASYPQMAKEDVGRAVQQAYGWIYGAEAVCIDVAARQFKVAGHAIGGYEAFRVKDSTGLDTWNLVNAATTNTSNGTFTLASADWQYGQTVVVDFRGKLNGDGSLMENPADIVEDILTELGETDLDTAAFAAAHAWFDVGYYPPDVLDRYTICAPSLYLDDPDEALDIISSICRDTRCYIMANADGEFAFKPFKLQQAKNLVRIQDGDLLEFKEEGDPSPRKISKVVVNYGHRRREEWCQTVTYERAKNQYTRDQGSAVTEALDCLFHRSADAQALAEWYVNTKDLCPLEYSITLKWGAMLWTQGDQVYLTYEERGLTKVLEVVELKHNLSGASTAIKATNVRGFDGIQGFWVADADTTGSGASLAWSSTEQPYKRFNSGHWHDANDFAVSSSPTVADRRVSVWS